LFLWQGWDRFRPLNQSLRQTQPFAQAALAARHLALIGLVVAAIQVE
jgi:hypothetical protein